MTEADKNCPEALPAPRGRRLQYSLRGLAIAVTIGTVWLGWQAHQARQQAAARKIVLEAGGQPLFDDDITGSAQPWLPAALRRVVGEDLFATVIRLNFPAGMPENDDCLAALKGLPGVTVINTESSRISDQGLEHLAKADLDCLRLIDAQITDRGLEHLRSHPRLSMLDLSGNQITDAGLGHLASLHRLEYLTLTGTAVSDEGIQELAKLSKLKYLNVQQTQVTAEGAARLKLRLPGCQIVH